MIYLDPESLREKREHVHVSEIRRFFGVRPNEPRIFNDTELTEFFTYRCELLGTKGDYFKKKAKNRGRMTATRRASKPNSPGEGVG